MLFHFNSEKKFAACPDVTFGALSITWLGFTLLDRSHTFCFLKKQGANQTPLSKTLTGWPLSTLTVSTQHPTALSLRRIHLVQERALWLMLFCHCSIRWKLRTGLWGLYRSLGEQGLQSESNAVGEEW